MRPPAPSTAILIAVMTNQPTIIESMRQAVPRGMKPDAKKAFYAAIGLLTSPCLKRPA